MHVLDIVFGILILFLALKGLQKGFLASLIQLLGLVVIVFTIAKAGQFVKLIVIDQLGWSDLVATIASYILIALIILIMIKIIIFLINRMVEFLKLKGLNKFLGALFGVINGLLLVAAIIIITDVLPYKEQVRNFTDKSFIVRHMRIVTDEIETKYPQVGKYKEPLIEQLDKKVEEGKEKLEEKVEEKVEEVL